MIIHPEYWTPVRGDLDGTLDSVVAVVIVTTDDAIVANHSDRDDDLGRRARCHPDRRVMMGVCILSELIPGLAWQLDGRTPPSSCDDHRYPAKSDTGRTGLLLAQ